MGLFRFGVFTFDSSMGELRRDGAIVRLQPQPAQVLGLLLENSGEVVTREALRQAVWGPETFVDFDGSLNFCVAQVRAALGDSIESPRFVRTLPKRGYQFIAPVERPAHSQPKLKWLAPALLAIAAGVLILLAVHPVPSKVTIAVTRFDNETGNSALDRFADGLTDSVVAELTASGAGRYGVIGNAAILRQPRAQRDLLTIGSSLRAGFVILGQVQSNGSGLRILAHLIRLPEQTHLTVSRLDCSSQDPLPTLSGLAGRIVADFSRRLAAERVVRVASQRAAND